MDNNSLAMPARKTIQKVRLLLRTPKTVRELLEAGIPKASAYYDIGELTKSGEISRIEGIDGKPRYVLKSTSLQPTKENLQLIMEKMNASHREVAEQALEDLDELSKVALLDDDQIVMQIVNQFLTQPNPALLRVIRRQASRAKDKHDNETLQHYLRCVPGMRRILTDTKREPENRENALLFLQVMNDGKLVDLSFAIISKHDKALNDAQLTQFAIVIESNCVSSARIEKWRRKLYELLTSKDNAIATRAKRILGQSRRSTFVSDASSYAQSREE